MEDVWRIPTLSLLSSLLTATAAKAAAVKAAFERVVEKAANETLTVATDENADSSTNYCSSDISVTEDPITA